MREKCHFEKKKRKKLGKRSRMYFAIFGGFRPILMIFIDQNMQIHDFPMIFCQKSMDPEPDFVQKSMIFIDFCLENHEIAGFE